MSAFPSSRAPRYARSDAAPIINALRFLARVASCVLVCVALVTRKSNAAEARIVSLQKIWDGGEHNAFTDLIRFDGRWICTFREGARHASPAGIIRVLESRGGVEWTSAALLSEDGIDLRDPKVSLTSDGRLMIVAGGSVMREGKYVSRQPRVYFSNDGRSWTASRKILEPGHWLWRVTWFGDKAYGVSYLGGGGTKEKRAAFLFESADGIAWRQITELKLPNISETTLRFRADGEMIAFSVLVHSLPGQPAKRATGVGTSRPPYREWRWREIPYPSGGPNFILMPDGRWLAGTRKFSADMKTTETVLAWLSLDDVRPFLTFPSGGDTSYPGLVWHEEELWTSFYSSHEDKTAIYLARVKLAPAP